MCGKMHEGGVCCRSPPLGSARPTSAETATTRPTTTAPRKAPPPLLISARFGAVEYVGFLSIQRTGKQRKAQGLDSDSEVAYSRTIRRDESQDGLPCPRRRRHLQVLCKTYQSGHSNGRPWGSLIGLRNCLGCHTRIVL